MATGYGVDTWCDSSLQPGRLVSGNRLLAQALYRRFTTPRGTLRGGPEEARYGLDLVGLVGTTDPRMLATLPAQIKAEAAKEDRVAGCSVSIISSTTQNCETSLEIAIDITPADEGEDFRLTLAVSGVSVDIVGELPL